VTGHASPASAEKDYKKGNFTLAEKEYAATLAKQPKQSELAFNLGSAAYKTGDYGQAATAFQNTLKTTVVPVQQSAYYNLGDTQYRLGQKTEKSNPQDTIKSWEQAVQSYEAALQIKPDDADAKYNRDLVKKKLEQLKKKQQEQQQKQNQQSKNQPQNQDQKNQDQKNQGQGQQDQKQQDQKNQQASQQNQHPAKAGSKGEEKKSPQPQQGQGQQPKPDGQKPENANGQQPMDKQAQAAENARSGPGDMTKEEAKQLLDSLKSDEHKLPPTQYSRAPIAPPDDQPLKDW
jgi:Ca-activated chloride channel family protein